ncbi:MAG: 2OG-Fe(II) oxygenase [Pseudomonadota bacterium]
MTNRINEVKPGSFVFIKHNALALDICQEMINRFEHCTEDQYPGRIGQTLESDLSIKRSTDIMLSSHGHWKDIDRELFRSLNQAMSEFGQQFPFFTGAFKDMGYGMQRTRPGEFYQWHIDGGSHDFADRQLVAIWYLNDVETGSGETEFDYQQIKIEPEAGKLLLFPPFWTHRHRGCQLESGIKYIATTWVVFA